MFSGGDDLSQAGGISAEALAEHGVQHPAGGVALHGIQELGAGKVGFQAAGGLQDDGFLIEVKVVVAVQKIQQYAAVCHGKVLL